jgi:succinyl-diaminopimelate desuccinylase
VLLRFNVRYNDRWTPETLVDAVNETIGNQDLQGTKVEFTVAGRPSRSFLSPVDGGGVETLIETIARRTGIPPELSTGGGTSDARFLKDYCPVVEFGLVGDTLHQVDERVPVADLGRLTAIYRRFLERFFAGAPATDARS